VKKAGGILETESKKMFFAFGFHSFLSSFRSFALPFDKVGGVSTIQIKEVFHLFYFLISLVCTTF